MALNTSLPGASTGRKVVMVSGTFAVAMGVGFFMQNENAEASLTHAGAMPMAIPAPGSAPTSPIDTPAVIDTSAAALPDMAVADLALRSDLRPQARLIPAAVSNDAAGTDANCEPTMAADVRDAALVELSITAPCNTNEAVTIHHEGMMFSALTDADGQASLFAAALNESALFIAAFGSGTGALAEITVPSLADFDRVVLQWAGDGAFEIHAMEGGATYGDSGHVWHNAPRTAASATTGDGGFLLALGDGRVESPRFAQVYTFPANAASKDVELSVEAEITPTNCATEIEAQTLERRAGEDIKILDLKVAVPACEAVGDYLVLKNVLQNLTLTNG
ncbi:MAG: hypothetical protein AAGF78_12440 [Pseudomonadota bacterium]